MHQQSVHKTKRIFSNSLVLFCRMLLLTLINLLSVRVLLKGLGIEDYGIYNAVAGLVCTATFIVTVLTDGMQRFYSISLAEKDSQKTRVLFSASIHIVVVLAILLTLVFESVGSWFLNTFLTIPCNRLQASNIVFQLSFFSFIIQIVQIPFMATVFANEKMGWYALFSTVECILRFTFALLIGHFAMDNMVFYATGYFFTSVVVFSLYLIEIWRNHPECRLTRHIEKDTYKNLLSFSGWTALGATANMGLFQGSTLLLNIFFGPVLNVVFAIALQVYNAFTSLCNNIVTAFKPAMIKSYAKTDYDYLTSLFMIGNKAIFSLTALVAVPLCVEMPWVLSVWLGEVPLETPLFCRLMILLVLCLSLNSPITIIVQASGRVKNYHLLVDSIMLMCVPVSLVVFALGGRSHYIMFTMVLLSILAHGTRLYYLKKIFPPISIALYAKDFLLRAVIVICIAFMITWEVHHMAGVTLFGKFTVVVCSTTVIAFSTLFLVLDAREREHIIKLIKSLKSPKYGI